MVISLDAMEVSYEGSSPIDEKWLQYESNPVMLAYMFSKMVYVTADPGSFSICPFIWFLDKQWGCMVHQKK